MCLPDASGQILPSFGGDRAGTSGFQFLKIAVDGRSAAMGETVVANAKDASALFWNPALAARTEFFQISANHTAYFTDVKMEFLAATFKPRGSSIAIGASVQTLSSGDMDVTTEFQPFGTGETFTFRDLAAGLTFSQSLTDLFSYGVTTKYVRESSAGISTSTVLFDLGIYYAVGNTGAAMGVAVRNFGLDGNPSGEIDRIVIGSPVPVVEDKFESITPPTTFLLGFSYELLRGQEMNDLTVSAQLNNPNDNVENWNVGVEYGWNRILVLRAGYRFGIEEYDIPSFGAGINIPYSGRDLRFDYGFSRLSRLGPVHRIGLNVSL
ncbi:MAG: PorV/PorQ family protein [Rhodothermales bacterium]|nr:PorV/PorQ family protein [Rhodothermales bacterium]